MRKSKVTTLSQLRSQHAIEERALILWALTQSKWGLRPAARALGILPTALVRLIAQHGIAELYAEHRAAKKEPK